MPDPFGAAAPVIFRAFADPEPIIYTQGGVILPPIRAIRTDEAAPAFEGPGSTLRKLAYEVQQRDLPAEPTKRDSFTHRGRLWTLIEATRMDDVGSWLLMVNDAGAAL